MKIWWHHPMAYGDVYKTYDDILIKHTDMLTAGTDLIVDHYWNQEGSPAIPYHSVSHQNTALCVAAMVEAEAQGYDAGVMGCSMDVGVKEGREAVNMPVIGMTEASMLNACLLGKNFSSITLGQKLKIRILELAKELGLEKKLASVRVIEMGLSEAGQALSEPQYAKKLKELFVEEANKAIKEDEAEVILPGCGVLSALCIREKIGQIEGTEVPVMDGVIASLGMSMTLITLKEKAGVTVSRAGTYASPPAEALKQSLVEKHFLKTSP